MYGVSVRVLVSVFILLCVCASTCTDIVVVFQKSLNIICSDMNRVYCSSLDTGDQILGGNAGARQDDYYI